MGADHDDGPPPFFCLRDDDLSRVCSDNFKHHGIHGDTMLAHQCFGALEKSPCRLPGRILYVINIPAAFKGRRNDEYVTT